MLYERGMDSECACEEGLASVRSSALGLIQSNIDYAKAVLEMEEHVGGIWNVTAREVTQNLVSVIRDKGQENQCGGLEDILLAFRCLQAKHMIDHSLLVSAICDSVEQLSLDVLILLMKECIVFPSLLLANDVAVSHLLESTLSCAKCVLKHSLMQDLSRILVVEAFPMEEDLTDENSSAIAAKTFLLRHITECFKPEYWTSSVYTLLHALNGLRDVSDRVIKCTYRYVLSGILSPPPTTIAIDEIIRDQSDYSFRLLPQSSVALFSMLGDALKYDEMLDIVRTTVWGQHQLNWKWILSCIACNLHLKLDFRNHFPDLLMDLVQKALDDHNKDVLLSSIILARHIESKSDFYGTWFKNTFGKAIISKRSLHLLVEALTSMVPSEPVEYLRIQHGILSSRSEQSVHDYLSLVRTRLLDSESLVLKQNGPTEMVEQSIEEFRCSGRISNTIIRASIFQSPFYMGSFLPSLMSVSSGEEDARHKLIVELFERNKIPKSMYSKYINARSSHEEPSLGEKADENFQVDRIVQMLSRGRITPDSLQQVFETFRLTLPSSRADSRPAYDFNLPMLLECHVKFVDELLDALCREITRDIGDQGMQCNWVFRVLDMVSEAQSILWSLLVRLRELLSKQITLLSRPHLRALSCIVVHLASSDTLPSLTLSLLVPARTLRTFGQWGTLLLESLPVTSQREMKAAFQFITYYLFFLCHSDCLSSFQHEPDPVLLAKLEYIWSRFSYSSKELVSITAEEKCNLLQHVDRAELSFTQWLDWELWVDCEDDFLHHYERVVYLEKTLRLFVNKSKSRGGLDGNYSGAVNHLFLALLSVALPSYTCGLSLLQGILSSYTWTSAPLVEAVQFSLKSASEMPHLYRAITKVLCDLPAQFFLTGTIGQSLSPLEAESTAACLTSIAMLSDSLFLPASLTFHIAKVLNSVSSTEEFCRICPLFHASLLVSLSGVSLPHVLHALDISGNFVSEAQRFFRSSEVQPNDDLPLEVLAVCMFYKYSFSDDADHDLKTSQLSQWLMLAADTVIAAFFDCCIRELAGVSLAVSDEKRAVILINVAEVCIRKKPWVLNVAQLKLEQSGYEKFLTTFRRNFPLPSDQLLPYAFFRIVTHISKSTLMEVCTCRPSLVYVCMSNHSQLMDIQHISHLHSYQAFEMMFLGKCTEITKIFMETCLPQDLKNARPVCHWTIKYLIDRISL